MCTRTQCPHPHEDVIYSQDVIIISKIEGATVEFLTIVERIMELIEELMGRASPEGSAPALMEGRYHTTDVRNRHHVGWRHLCHYYEVAKRAMNTCTQRTPS